MNPITAFENARRAEFAIACRKIRLWIAANPGCTRNQIRVYHTHKPDFCLGKMLGMQIIRSEKQLDQNGKTVARWYVVPQ